MQLNQPGATPLRKLGRPGATPLRKLGRIAAGLSMLSANLLGASAALAQDDDEDVPQVIVHDLMKEPAPGPDTYVYDSSVLFYKESGSRVQAVEPVFNVQNYLANGSIIGGTFTFDSLSGATPNGATPSTLDQTFNSIVREKIYSTQASSSGASGGGTVTTIPGTTYAKATYGVSAYALPLASFHDHRFAGNGSFSWLTNPDTRLNAGLGASIERDYTTVTGNFGIARDLNQKNTTLSLTVNLEEDISRPYNGTPAPFQDLSTQINGGNDTKATYGILAGISQTLSRFWITQVNFNLSGSKGYQADPYRVLSMIDATTGLPTSYLFENRPRNRTRESVYWGNKLALGPTVADASVRYYHDTWGINALTAEVSEQVPLGGSVYIKPLYRYYHQTAANFFAYYLVSGDALPTYASSDSRLSRFNANTIGGKLGVRVFHTGEFYIEGESYRQSGARTVAGAPGALAGLDLFSGVHAISVMTGLRLRM
jgi:hypothetical protein